MFINDENQKPEETSADDQDFSKGFAAALSGDDVGEIEKPDANASDDDKQQDAEKPASDAADEKSAAQPGSAVSDPWAGLSPEQEAYFKSLQHSEQSQRGRVAALTRKLNPAHSAPAPEASDESKGEGKTESTEKASDLDTRLKQATEDYPDAVGPLVEVIADIRKEIGKLSAQVEPLAEDQDTAALTKAYVELEKAHPDYRTISADANFSAWIADQPGNIQQMANSFDAREVSLTLTLFKAERQAAMAGGNEGQPNNDATGKKRERQLEGSKQVPSKGAPAAAGTPNDFSSAFKAKAQEFETS